ncbi:hypothetical protein FRB93_008500 [Tulasnella sp. JGI-2019a]|nr:hypothetical protein FRB93_008500 [Tulasnella sp. JGI-2019a]
MIESSRMDISNEALLSRLHTAYPLIDTALIAALLSESEGDRGPDVINNLLETFEMLTLQAKSDNASFQTATDEEALSSLLSEGNSTTHDETDTTEASWMSSTSGTNSDYALAFLMMAFPDHSPALLQDAIAAEQKKHLDLEDEVDMEAIVQSIMSSDFIEELQQRGLDEAVADQEEKSRHRDWSAIAPKKKGKKKAKKERDKDSNGSQATLLFGDVQQRQQRPPPARIHTGQAGSSAAHPDPWTHLSSLACRLSELLPPLLASHFLSLFHAPQSGSPAKALRQELQRIGGQQAISDDVEAQALALSDILQDEGSALHVDTTLCLRAVGGDIDTALELIWLLADLDRIGPVILHSPINNAPSSPVTPVMNRGWSTVVSGSRPTRSSSIPISPPIHSPQRTSSEHNAWTTVAYQPRPKPTIELDPLGEFIPAYKNMPAGWRAKSGRGSDEPELDEALSEQQCRYWSKYYQAKRDESLKDASKYWKKNWTGAKGGDVAMVYAEDSREYGRLSKLWALKAARVMVEGRQRSGTARNTIDLHGLTTSEAVTVSNEATNKWWNSSSSDGPPAQALTLITGRGNHSKGGVGVIGPAVQNALEAEGWQTSKRPGAILVTGWKHGSRR